MEDSFSDINALLAGNSFQITPGIILANKYKVDKVIGKGGMGKIYKARDLVLDRDVCIKRVLSSQNSPEQLERFKREHDFLSHITHPNLVKVIAFFEERGEPFLVMEFLEGITLQDCIKYSPKSLSFLDQLAIASQIARSVEILNTAGILHRDIKPANIMINDKENVVKLLDLGLAKNLKGEAFDLTGAGDIIGTPEYMSPEQVRGTYSNGSDIFSLGVTLYQFFLWLPSSPFKGQAYISTMTNIVEMHLPPLYEKIEKTGKDKEFYVQVSFLLEQCLEKDSDIRLQSAKVLADKLGKLYTQLKEVQANQINVNKNLWNMSVALDKDLRKKLEILSQKYGKDEAFQTKKLRASRIERRRKLQRANLKRKLLYILPIIFFCITISWFQIYRTKIWKKEQEKLITEKKAETAKKHFEKAFSFYRKACYTNAQEEISKACDGRKLPEYIALKAIILFHTEKKAEAKSLAKEIVSELKKKPNKYVFYFLATFSWLGIIEKKNVNEAYVYYKSSALLGLPDSMVSLGAIYEVYRKNFTVAFSWYTKAKKHSQAYLRLSDLYFFGRGVDVDYKKSYEFAYKSFEMKNILAMAMLSVKYDKGFGVKKNVVKAFQFAKKAADMKVPQAMVSLANYYLEGKVVKQNKTKGMHLLLKAAKKNSIKAMLRLYKLYHTGQYIPVNMVKALTWYKSAYDLCFQEARQNNLNAMRELGYIIQVGPDKNYDRAMSWFRRAATFQDIPSILFIAGILLRQGDYNGSLFWYKKAAQMKDPFAIKRLIYLFEKMGNTTEALILYKKLSDSGNEEAMLKVADIYLEKYDDYKKAYGYYKKLALKDNSDAMVKLAGIYLSKHYKNYSKAFMWYKRAALLKNDQALYSLGNLYYKGKYTSKKLSLAFSYYKEAAKLGNVKAMVALANLYREGKGTMANVDAAELWYEKAIKQKSVEAAYQLARMYRNRVDKTGKDIITLYKKGAMQNHVKSLYELAKLYRKGLRVKKDYYKAFFFYQKAAKLGHKRSMNILGYMYKKGIGVRKNLEKSRKWYAKYRE